MKTHLTPVGIVAVLAAPVYAAEPVSKEQVWTETYPVTTPAPLLVIDNIWGSVRVRSGDADQIVVTVDERRSAPSEALFERSLELLSLEIDADADGVSMVVGEPHRQWRGRNPCRGCRVDYHFEVVVPPGSQLNVGTVNDGRVDVEGVTGPVSANNVNGPVNVSDIHECGAVDSVNGAVTLSFARAPSQDCAVETINGDVKLAIPSDTGLDVTFDLFNGRITSEFDVVPLSVPARVERSSHDGSYRYRIEQPAGVRVGRGGPTFSFTSLNGDIRILKNQ